MLLLAGAAAQAAPPEADPATWLRGVYDRYQHAENDISLLKQSAEETALSRASRGFAPWLKRNLDCEARFNRNCAYFLDFFVNASVWDLSHVEVGALQVSGARATVTTTFDNQGKANRNVYEFVREDGAWKLDDIVSGQSGRAPIRISQRLHAYDFRRPHAGLAGDF